MSIRTGLPEVARTESRFGLRSENSAVEDLLDCQHEERRLVPSANECLLVLRCCVPEARVSLRVDEDVLAADPSA